MKNKLYITAFLLFIRTIGFAQLFGWWPWTKKDYDCVSYQQSASIPACDGNNFRLIFEDDFNGTSLDLTKWKPTTGVPRDVNFSQAKQWYLPQNAIVNLGSLSLTATQEYSTHTFWVGGSPPTKTADFSYTGAEVTSNYKFYYGKYEIRCRLPYGIGFFPAFWLWGDKPANRSELDIFDDLHLNENDHECGVGYEYDGDGHSYGCRYRGHNTVSDLRQWHVYTCIFEPDKIEWQVDYSTFLTQYRYKDNSGLPYLCSNPPSGYINTYQDKSWPMNYMAVIANLAVKCGDGAPNGSTPFPNQMEVDYIRVFKRLNCSSDITFTTLSQLNLNSDPAVFNYICGKHITFDGSITLPNPQNLTVSATHSIDFKPGFTAGEGIFIDAMIKPDPLYVTIAGPSFGNNTGTYTWNAVITGGNDAYTYLWQYSNDFGATYQNMGSTSSSITAQLPMDQDLYLRLVVVSADGQTAYSDRVIHNGTHPRPTGVNEFKDSEVSIFPNPTNGEVTINFNTSLSSIQKKILVVNEQGATIIERVVSGNDEQINLNSYSSGIYLVRILDEKNVTLYTKRVIKQ